MNLLIPALILEAAFLAAPQRLKTSITIVPEKAQPGERVEFRIDCQIESGWHVYSPDFKGTGIPTQLKMEEGSLRPDGKLLFPEPRRRRDDVLGEDVLYLEGKFRLTQPLRVPENAPAGTAKVKGELGFQSCSETVCEPPTNIPVEAAVEILPGSSGPVKSPAGGEADPGWLGFLLLAIAAIAAGGASVLMPCTYPMIPITISYFTRQATEKKSSVIPLALAYGAGIVIDFVLIGVLVGPPIIAFAKYPITNLFEIRLPSSLNTLASRASGARSYIGVFLLGTTLVITSFACTAPFIGVILVGGAQARGFLEIVVGMTFFGLTMALPFVALALLPTAVRSIPKSGEWMHTLKVTLGFIVLAASLYFLSRADQDLHAFPREVFLYTLAGIAFTAALYLFGLIRIAGEGAGIGPLRMFIGMLVLIFALYCVHGTRYRLDWVMESFVPSYGAERIGAEGAAGGQEIAWTLVEDDFEGGLKKARDEGKLALLNWTGIT
jgi:cytochrome c biogenesis protein CcdA